ncbi:conserved hypothetical protein [Ricinus communis]|uniref:Uncharacterized protein n=1 Tax=Ricinus communis TaxID=3988 RepID=B9S2K5_RICCO|nr:conserved hypothetical protein [Ricinus communis]
MDLHSLCLTTETLAASLPIMTAQLLSWGMLPILTLLLRGVLLLSFTVEWLRSLKPSPQPESKSKKVLVFPCPCG